MTNLDVLRSEEERAKISTLAMMSYIASRSAPLFEKGGIRKFKKIAWRKFGEIKEINEKDFNDFHSRFVNEIKKEIKTKEGDEPTYGHAQKPVNVFLKVIVDWANLPDENTAKQLRKFLHVPLDRVLMKEFKKALAKEFEEKIKPEYEKAQIPHYVTNKYATLRFVNKAIYLAWQSAFREVYLEKPVLLDVMWFLNRGARE